MEDLTSLCGPVGEALVGGQSQAAGNTVNHPNGTMGSPGSAPVNSLPAVSELDDPAVEVPAATDYTRRPR